MSVKGRGTVFHITVNYASATHPTLPQQTKATINGVPKKKKRHYCQVKPIKIPPDKTF